MDGLAHQTTSNCRFQAYLAQLSPRRRFNDTTDCAQKHHGGFSSKKRTYFLQEDGNISLASLAFLGRLPVGVGGGAAVIVHGDGAVGG